MKLHAFRDLYGERHVIRRPHALKRQPCPACSGHAVLPAAALGIRERTRWTTGHCDRSKPLIQNREFAPQQSEAAHDRSGSKPEPRFTARMSGSPRCRHGRQEQSVVQGRSWLLMSCPLRHRDDITGWQVHYGFPFAQWFFTSPNSSESLLLTRSKTSEIGISAQVWLGNSISSVDFDFPNL
jgi:hypothetical protein